MLIQLILLTLHSYQSFELIHIVDLPKHLDFDWLIFDMAKYKKNMLYGDGKSGKKIVVFFRAVFFFHNSAFEYHMIDFSKELMTSMKNSFLNFQFETDNFR